MCAVGYPKFIVSNQKEESTSIQRFKHKLNLRFISMISTKHLDK